MRRSPSAASGPSAPSPGSRSRRLTFPQSSASFAAKTPSRRGTSSATRSCTPFCPWSSPCWCCGTAACWCCTGASTPARWCPSCCISSNSRAASAPSETSSRPSRRRSEPRIRCSSSSTRSPGSRRGLPVAAVIASSGPPGRFGWQSRGSRRRRATVTSRSSASISPTPLGRNVGCCSGSTST